MLHVNNIQLKPLYFTVESTTTSGCDTRVFCTFFWVPARVNFFNPILKRSVEIVCDCTVRIMDEENGNPLPQPTTPDSEGHNKSDILHVERSLPKNLTDPLRKDNHTECLFDANEDDKETGLGYDSNEDADELNDIDDEMQMAWMLQLMSITEHESNEDIEVSDRSYVEFDSKLSKNILPKDIKIHCIPEDWNNPDKNEPPFDEIDNP